MPIFICHCHLLKNLLNILVGGFHRAIHLWLIQRKTMVSNLELHAELCDHGIVEIGTNICDDPLGYAIPTYEIMLNEPGHNILGNRGK